MSDEEIEQAALDDPDAQPLSDEKLAGGFRPKALTALRKRLGLSQAEFARQFLFNLRTLQDWEQGRREPEGIARTYLRVIERNPDAVKAALQDRARESRPLKAPAAALECRARGSIDGTVNLAGWPRLRGRARVINRVG